ncbi:MAG: oligosaccharide flippase family protein [Christensenellales bacterium]
MISFINERILLTRIVGFFIRIFMSRTLGAEIIGIYQIACSIASVFLTIVSSGIPLSISRFSAEFLAQKEYSKSSKMITSGTLISAGLAVLICILTLIFKPLIIKLSASTLVASVLIALLPTVVATSLNVGFKGYLWGAQKHFANCFVDFVEQIVKFILILIMVPNAKTLQQGIINCALSVSIACVLSTTISMCFYFKHKGRFSNPKGYIKPLLKKSTPITMLRIASSIGGMLISFIMPIMLVKVGYSSEQAISLFGIALGMTLPLLYLPNTLVGSLCTALIPDLAKLKAEHNMEEFSSKVKTSFVFSVFISLFLVPCFSAVGKEIGVFVYNNELSGVMLEYSALIMLPMGINDIASSVLNSLGYEIKSFKNYVFGSVFLIFSIIFLPKYFGIYALLIGMAGSLIISGYLNLKMIKKELKLDKIIIKEMCYMCLFLVPSILINKFSFRLLSKVFTTFFSIAISSILGAIFFTLLCLIFKIFTLNTLLINFKNIKILKRKKKSKKTV